MSGYSTICDVIPGYWSPSCLGQSSLRLQERKCLINALFLYATRKRAYPFIQLLRDWWPGEAQKKREVSRLWKPTKYSAVCSKHFLDEDYSVIFSGLTTVDFQWRLRKEDFGIHGSTQLVFLQKAHQLKASEARGRWENMYLRVMSSFRSCCNFVWSGTCFFHLLGICRLVSLK